MDKKKKIILISTVSIIVVMGLIMVSVKNGKSKESGSDAVATANEEVVNENKEGATDEVVKEEEKAEEGVSEEVTSEEGTPETEWDPASEPEPAPANGANSTDFETKIVELGYQKFDDTSYDYFENDISLVFVQMETEGTKLWINNKSDISNDKIKSAITLLLPNTVDELIKLIEDGTTELTASLDNRSVSILIKEEKLELFITN